MFLKKEGKILGLVVGITLCSLTALTVYSGEKEPEKQKNPEKIEIILKNFKKIRHDKGECIYEQVIEEGIPVREHVVIVEKHNYWDDGVDKEGNEYFIYMVDRPEGLKALITLKKLDPVENLDNKLEKFAKLVEDEIEKDGGVESIIRNYKK